MLATHLGSHTILWPEPVGIIITVNTWHDLMLIPEVESLDTTAFPGSGNGYVHYVMVIRKYSPASSEFCWDICTYRFGEKENTGFIAAESLSDIKLFPYSWRNRCHGK